MTERAPVPFGKPWITDEDRAAVARVLQGDVLTHGPEGRALERDFAAFLGDGAHAVTVSSGMAALHLAYIGLGIGPGDEVLVPAQTHTATAHAVEAVGARPVFVDSEPETGNLDPARLEALVGPRTRAIGLVHFLGVPCDMDAVMAIAARFSLKVVEDCALAVGARYRGRHVGLIGDAGCFSFYPVKHMTTGDGGMLVSRNADFAAKAVFARGFGVDRAYAERVIPGMYDVPTLGLNYRMSDINAALGRSQLARMDTILERRRANFANLAQAVAEIEGLRVLGGVEQPEGSAYYCLSVVLQGSLAGRRDDVVREINARGVGTSVYYPHPVPRLQYYRQKYGYAGDHFPHAARISDASIALPVGPHLSEADVARVADAVRQAVAR